MLKNSAGWHLYLYLLQKDIRKMFPSQPAPLLLEMSVSEQPGLSRAENTNSEQTIKKFTQNYLFQTLLRIVCTQKGSLILRFLATLVALHFTPVSK